LKKGLMNMKSNISIVFAAAVLASVTQANANPADYYECGDMIAVEGQSTGVEGSADFKKYNGHVPENLAELRAISGWQSAVADHCPEFSAIWRRAEEKSINCDAGVGHVTCTATAIPAQKILTKLFGR
jgi:hypothetical protein